MRIQGTDRRGNPIIIDDPNPSQATQAYRQLGAQQPGFAERNAGRAVRAGTWFYRNADWVLGGVAGALLANYMNDSAQMIQYAPSYVTAAGAAAGAYGGRYLRNRFSQ